MATRMMQQKEMEEEGGGWSGGRWLMMSPFFESSLVFVVEFEAVRLIEATS